MDSDLAKKVQFPNRNTATLSVGTKTTASYFDRTKTTASAVLVKFLFIAGEQFF